MVISFLKIIVSNFLGDVKKSLELAGIKKCESSAYHPQSQGKVERSHGTWKSKLRYDIESSEGLKYFSNLFDQRILIKIPNFYFQLAN